MGSEMCIRDSASGIVCASGTLGQIIPPSIVLIIIADELAIASAIDPNKDVDGFHPINLGKIVQGNVSGLLPCTPSGVMHLLKVSGFDTVGKKAVVIGRSRIVGMPMALLLSQRGVDSTVTIAHSKTDELRAICEDSDIVIAAIGRIHTVKSDWIKPGAFVALSLIHI